MNWHASASSANQDFRIDFSILPIYSPKPTPFTTYTISGAIVMVHRSLRMTPSSSPPHLTFPLPSDTTGPQPPDTPMAYIHISNQSRCQPSILWNKVKCCSQIFLVLLIHVNHFRSCPPCIILISEAPNQKRRHCLKSMATFSSSRGKKEANTSMCIWVRSTVSSKSLEDLVNCKDFRDE